MYTRSPDKKSKHYYLYSTTILFIYTTIHRQLCQSALTITVIPPLVNAVWDFETSEKEREGERENDLNPSRFWKVAGRPRSAVHPSEVWREYAFEHAERGRGFEYAVKGDGAEGKKGK